MTDWKNYFKTRLTDKGQFILEKENRHGDVDLLIFKSADNRTPTIIEVGILTNGYLITTEFVNPRTPGFTKQQRLEFFYRYSFHPTDTYGDPGLEFVDYNINHFDKLLKEGLKGKEVQYFKRGQLIKSEIFQFYADNGNDNYGTTIKFQEKGLIKRILDLFKTDKDLYDDKKEIELKEIFNGVE